MDVEAWRGQVLGGTWRYIARELYRGSHRSRGPEGKGLGGASKSNQEQIYRESEPSDGVEGGGDTEEATEGEAGVGQGPGGSWR